MRNETIKVNLTDESKTVRANDPEHHRFLAVRNGIFNLIDEEDYRAWTKKIEEYIEEMNPDL